MKKGFAYVPVIIIAIIVIGAVLLGTNVWNPSWNPFTASQSPQVINQAIAKMTGLDSFKAQGVIQVEFEAQEDGITRKGSLSASFSELVDVSDKDNPKAYIDMEIELGMEGVIIQLTGNVINIGNDLYIRLTTIPALPIPGLDLSMIKDQWFKISAEQVVDSEIDEERFVEELKTMLAGVEIISIKKSYGQEDVDGEKADHYLAEIKKSAVKQLIPAFMELVKGYMTEEQKAQYEAQKQEFLKQFNDNFDNAWTIISPLEFDIWINNYIKRVKVDKKINIPESGDNSIIMDFIFSDFNESFEIEAPIGAKSIEEILNLFLPLISTE